MNAATTPETTLEVSIPQRWLLVARAAWVSLAILALGIIAFAIPARLAHLSTITPTPDGLGELLPADALALEALGLSVRFYAIYFTVLETGLVLGFGVIAAVIFWRRSTDRMALLTAFALLPFGMNASPIMDSLILFQPALRLPVLFMRALGLLGLVVFFFVFPDGRFVPRWMRWLAALWIGYTVAWLLYPPIAPRSSLVISTTGQALLLAWLVFWLIAGAYAQIVRYFRFSGPTQRQQTKWVVFGFAVTVGLITLVALPSIVSPGLREPGVANMVYELIAFSTVLFSSMFFIATIGISILRYRLFDIDNLINRALVYSALTAALALVYFACIVLLQSAFRALTGQQSQLAVVLSTLAIAALFTPLRRRIQDVIDRRFYRRRYDTQQTLARFATTTRDEVDVELLSHELLAVVNETIQPEHASLWLRAIERNSLQQ